MEIVCPRPAFHCCLQAMRFLDCVAEAVVLTKRWNMVKERVNGWLSEWWKPVITALITGAIVSVASYTIQVPVIRAETNARLTEHERRLGKVEGYCEKQVELQREIAERLKAIETELALLRKQKQ